MGWGRTFAKKKKKMKKKSGKLKGWLESGGGRETRGPRKHLE